MDNRQKEEQMGDVIRIDDARIRYHLVRWCAAR